jgi:hypothetical protein
MRQPIPFRVAGLLLFLIVVVATMSSSVRGQTAPPPIDPHFQPARADSQALAVNGPFALSKRRLAQLASRTPRPDHSVEIDEEVGDDLDVDPPCPECTFGAPDNPDPYPTVELPQTPPPTSKFTSTLGVSDPQIAAGDTYLVVTLNDQIAFFSKDGTQLQQATPTSDFFQPLTDVINATLVEPANLDPSIWKIDRYYDMRTVFDPYRKRFWIAGAAINSQTFQSKDPVIGPARRNFTVAAVSLTEDPRDGWYLYWWNAVIGGYDCAPNCTKVIGADYPSIGISPQYFLHEIGAEGSYSNVVAIDADALAAGACNNCSAHQFWNFVMPDNCRQTYPYVIQPAVHHSDPLGFQWFAMTWVYPDKPICQGGQARAANAPDKYDLVLWMLDLQTSPPQWFFMTVPVKPFAVSPGQKPGYPKVNQMDAEQPPNAQIPTPNFIKMDNIPNIAMKAVVRDDLLYVTWEDCVKWPPASTCYTSIRLERLNIFSPQNAQRIDRSFGLRNVFDDGPADFVYYGVPAVEVNKFGNMAVIYQRSGTTVFPQARYSTYFASGADILPSRALQVGDFPFGMNAVPGAEIPRGPLDVAGISVDPFDDTGIWMAHGYSTQAGPAAGTYALAIGKVFGRAVPDLVPSGISIPASANQGDSILIQLKVKNQGDGKSKLTKVRLELTSDTTRTGLIPLVDAPLDAIDPADYRYVMALATIPAGTQAGQYFVRATVDPDNAVLEYNDDNNIAVSATPILVKKP